MLEDSLEARIAAWPGQWKAARLEYSSARAHLADLQLQLDRLTENAPDTEPNPDAPQGPNTDPALIAADLDLLKLEHEVRVAALEAEHIKAVADVAIREHAADTGLKLTESAVEARVKSDKDALAAQRAYLNLRHQVDMAKVERAHLFRRLQEEWRVRQQEERFSAEPSVSSNAEQILLDEIDQATAYVNTTRAELGYQQRMGKALGMLVTLGTMDASMAPRAARN